MHLDSLRLERFRSCLNVSVNVRPDLTVLVGENNGGKSNIIDGLRLLTLPLNGRRERYPEEEDLRRGSAERTFTLEGRFCGLSDTVKGLLLAPFPIPRNDCRDLRDAVRVQNVRNSRGKTFLWAGKFDTAEPEQGATELIRHVFLPPLRDARRRSAPEEQPELRRFCSTFWPTAKKRGFSIT